MSEYRLEAMTSAPKSGPSPRQTPDRPETYDPAAVEAKWQARWRDRATNATDLAGGRDPFYALMMFPYPSAEGLHVGNLFAFTGNDILARFRRMRGQTVFEPLGFDAFGIHSENYALKLGIHPAELIPRNIANFRRQLERAGLMVDWRYSVDTTDPRYYRWTQWIFLQLYKLGLAKKRAPAHAIRYGDEGVMVVRLEVPANAAAGLAGLRAPRLHVLKGDRVIDSLVPVPIDPECFAGARHRGQFPIR